MSYELHLLRALVRLSRRQADCSDRALLARVGGSPTTITEGLNALEALGLITLVKGQARLTLEGLALGVAASPSPLAAAAPEKPAAPKSAPRLKEERRVEPRIERRAASRRMSGTVRSPARRAA